MRRSITSDRPSIEFYPEEIQALLDAVAEKADQNRKNHYLWSAISKLHQHKPQQSGYSSPPPLGWVK